MKRFLQITAIAGVFAVIAAACGSSEPGTSTNTAVSIQKGGTLHVVMSQDFFHGLDPTEEYYAGSFEILRCCLARTLYSFNGKNTEEGGTVPLPDLAADDPVVSDDGLTWTFTLRDGIMFGDPLNRPIVAQDFVNAFNRFEDDEINTFSYPFYYTFIKGFDYPNGDKDVPGVVAVDDKTLRFDLTEPNEDVPFLVGMPATAPLPTELIESHYKGDDLGHFLISSGPYEYEGWKDSTLAGTKPPSGVDPTRSYVLVRNPSWTPESDPVRADVGYPDRMEFTVGGEVQDLLDKVDKGDADWCLDCQATAVTLSKYQADPASYNPTDPSACDPQPCRLQIWPGDGIAYTGLNVFQPPFDDVHVRKAVNWALDKDALWRLAGGAASGVIAGHFIPPSMIGGMLSDYDPYASENNQGDPVKAKAEMALSKYDTDQDGVCDAPECEFDGLTVTNDNDAIKALQIAAQSYKAIGLKMNIKQLSYNALVTKCSTLAGHTPYCQAGWVKDFPDAYTFFYPLLDQGENGSNYSFMGTTPEDLQKAGYTVPDEMPSITDDINTCHAMPLGDEANQCWADLDKKVTEDIAPVIPRRFFTAIDVLGPNITNYSFDQWGTVGDPSQMALGGGGG